MDQQQVVAGRFFRRAWVAGVKKHFPGEPKPGYVSDWEEMAEWEQQSAIVVYNQVRELVLEGAGVTAKLSREQRGRFVALLWIVQVFKHIPNPKPGYVADWDQLPAWQQATDADIFDQIEAAVLQERAQARAS
jgi:hypothetical protein